MAKIGDRVRCINPYLNWSGQVGTVIGLAPPRAFGGYHIQVKLDPWEKDGQRSDSPIKGSFMGSDFRSVVWNHEVYGYQEEWEMFVPKPVVSRAGLNEVEHDIAPPMRIAITIPLKYGEQNVVVYIGAGTFNRQLLQEEALKKIALDLVQRLER